LIQLALKRKKTPNRLERGSQMQYQQRSTTINKPGSGRSSNPNVRKYVCLRRSRPSKGIVRYLRYKKAKWAGGSCRRLGKVAGLCRKHVEAWDGSASCQHNACGPFTACRLAGLFHGHCRVASQPAPDRAVNLPSGPCKNKEYFEVIERKALPLCCACDGVPPRFCRIQTNKDLPPEALHPKP